MWLHCVYFLSKMKLASALILQQSPISQFDTQCFCRQQIASLFEKWNGKGNPSFPEILFGALHILSQIFLFTYFFVHRIYFCIYFCAHIFWCIAYITAHIFVRLYFGAYHIYAAAAAEEHKSPISSSFASKLFLNLQFPFFCLNLSLQYQGASSIAIKLLCFQVTKCFHNFP